MKLALFGGTFDPLHTGHLVAAQDVVEALGVDVLYFVPAGLPPHKRDRSLTPGALRLRMLRRSLEGDPRMAALDLELRRDGPSYTVDTLREMSRRRPDAELYFVMGVDQFAQLHSWKEPSEVARLARLTVITREGDDPDAVDPGVEVPWEFLPVTRVDVSSSDVRRRVRDGRSIRYLVPEAVRRIVESERLYRAG